MLSSAESKGGAEGRVRKGRKDLDILFKMRKEGKTAEKRKNVS